LYNVFCSNHVVEKDVVNLFVRIARPRVERIVNDKKVGRLEAGHQDEVMRLRIRHMQEDNDTGTDHLDERGQKRRLRFAEAANAFWRKAVRGAENKVAAISGNARVAVIATEPRVEGARRHKRTIDREFESRKGHSHTAHSASLVADRIVLRIFPRYSHLIRAPLLVAL